MKSYKSYVSLCGGQSIVEVIVALAIFIMIATTSVVAILGSFSTTRLSEEESFASMYAEEGIEAVNSIRNFSWDVLTDGTYGLSNAGGVWEFTGSSDSDASGKFTRQITITSVNRSEDGEIVDSGGIPDNDTKKITARVDWAFSPARNNKVEMTTYLTNWQEAVKPAGILEPTLTPSPTPTLSLTPTNSPTPTATPAINTCASFCQNGGYIDGTCRNNPNQCTSNGEVYQSGGNAYCTLGPTRCCCLP